MENKIERVNFFLTGFGKFAGVEKNPTSELMESLNSFLAENPLEKKENVSIRSTTIVETSGEAVREYIVKANSEKDVNENQINVFLHFGVHGSSDSFALEKVFSLIFLLGHSSFLSPLSLLSMRQTLELETRNNGLHTNRKSLLHSIWTLNTSPNSD